MRQDPSSPTIVAAPLPHYEGWHQRRTNRSPQGSRTPPSHTPRSLSYNHSPQSVLTQLAAVVMVQQARVTWSPRPHCSDLHRTYTSQSLCPAFRNGCTSEAALSETCMPCVTLSEGHRPSDTDSGGPNVWAQTMRDLRCQYRGRG